MARRRNSSRHHRRGRFTFLYKLLSILVICGVVILALTLFFRVDTVVATGQIRYTTEGIAVANWSISSIQFSLASSEAVQDTLFQQLTTVIVSQQLDLT